jgi:predicted aspartyl protease
MPETLIPVPMLFINVEINNKKCATLVDTGAKSTFMSLDLCRRCGLMNLVDK